MGNVILVHPFVILCALVQHMGLDLVDHWWNPRKGSQIHQSPVRPVIIIKRLVEQHQVQIIGLKLAQRFFHGLFGFLIPVMLHPYFVIR